MKTIRSLSHWFVFLGINGAFITGLFWADRLDIQPLEHTLLSIVMVVIFWILVNNWITEHEIGLLVDKITKDSIPLCESHYRIEKSPDSENHHA